MTLTNGQVLLIVLILVVMLIRKYLSRRRRFTKIQLKKFSSLSHANSEKAWNIGEELRRIKEYLEFLSIQQQEDNAREVFLVLIKACNTQMNLWLGVSREWHELGSYVDRGIFGMGDIKYGCPSINIRKQYKSYYKKSKKASKTFKILKRAEELLRESYKNSFMLEKL